MLPKIALPVLAALLFKFQLRQTWLFLLIFSSGGVVLASRDGKIVCENTLDARLDVVFRKKLPEVNFFMRCNS